MISLISHLSKAVLKIILNRLKLQAEIIAEEQAGFWAGRSTPEQIFNLKSFVRNISDTSKTSTMSSQTSRRPRTGFGIQLCWQPWRNTTLVPTLSETPNSSMTRLHTQSTWMAAKDTDSEQQLESVRDVYSHPSTSIHFWKASWQTPWKIMKALSALEAEQSPISTLLMTSIKINWATRQSLHSLQHGD